PLLLIAVYSPKRTYDQLFLANYAYINLADPLSRVYGVGQISVFGYGQYAMRLWVNPDQLAKLGITINEIATAIQNQNTANPSG
ncbi:efflux RND transporter permease subunit, partial [Acinetobacter baumannii]